MYYVTALQAKNSGNEYRYTVPKTAIFINKNQLSDEKNNSKNSQIKKTHSRLYILILFYLKVCIYTLFFHPANIY